MQFDKKTGMSIFIAVIMIVSVIGFSLTMTEPAEEIEYGDYTFTRTQQGWQTKINEVKTQFYFHPVEVEDIIFDEGAGVAIDGIRVTWFTYDPKDSFAQEIADDLFYMEEYLGKANIYVQRGLTNNTDYLLPEINCVNATITVPVFLLKSGNETSIRHENGCIIATAESARDVYRVGDRMLYEVFGVI